MSRCRNERECKWEPWCRINAECKKDNMNRKPAEPAIQETDELVRNARMMSGIIDSNLPYDAPAYRNCKRLLRRLADRIESLTRARDEVIEQCAKVCDNLGDGGGMVRDKWGDRQASVTDCATAIRALKHSGADKVGSYWLIERRSPCEWWVSNPPEQWTTDSSEAQRFSCEWGAAHHAKQLEQWGIRGPLRATEHIDCNGPDSSGADKP